MLKVVIPSRAYAHHAFVTTSVVLESEPKLVVDNKQRVVQVGRPINAGIYGFTNKEVRDKFVRRINSTISGMSEVTEIAFACEVA